MTSLHPNSALQKSVLDRIIPPVADLPGAGGLGIEKELERMSTEHHKFSGILFSAIESIQSRLGEDTVTVENLNKAISGFESFEPTPFALLLELVYLAYYSDPRVHDRIGWKTGPLQPEGHPLPPWEESILAKVKNRAPFWIEVD